MRASFQGWALLFGVALAGGGLAGEPAWVGHVREGTLAFARLEVPAGQGHYCRAVETAPFGEEDPRYPILLYNRAVAAFCCGSPRVEGCPSDIEEKAGVDLFRTGELVAAQGVDRTPDYAVVLWHAAIARANRCGRPFGPPVVTDCLDRGELERVAKLLVEVAPAFAEEVTWTPGGNRAGLREQTPTLPSSWMVQERQGGEVWPRAMVLTDFLDPPMVGRKVFPSFALDQIAQLLAKHGDAPAAHALYLKSAQLAEAALGPSHPRSVRGWYDYARRCRKLAPAQVSEHLVRLIGILERELEHPEHPDLIPFLLELYRAQEAAGQIQLARGTRERARKAGARPDDDHPFSRRLRVDLAPNPSGSRMGVPLGERARRLLERELGAP